MSHTTTDYDRARGEVDIPRVPDYPPELAETRAREQGWRDWMVVGVGMTALLAIIAIIFGVVAIAQTDSSSSGPASSMEANPATASKAAVNPAFAPAPTLAAAKGMPYERFQPVNPNLPAVPTGTVKHFRVGVMQHITQVDPNLAPVQAWTYTVNGVGYRGTAASPPIVVNQGDRVQIEFVNGTSKSMGVDMAHSIDFHAAHLPPNKYYTDVAPGKSETFSFVAKYAGAFMYHCATQPVLTHTGTGMTGMMVVKPRNLPPVARELWITQQEFYIGQAGGIADQAKLAAENPDVVAFNGYANEYKLDPITAPAGKPIRVWVLNAGPSRWSAFHVIGTVFDTTDVEGVVAHGSQTVSLAPSQGGWVQFTLESPGNYPFVTHDFGSMVKGAAGMLHTPGAPPPKGAPPAPTGGSTKPVTPNMVHVTALGS
ncbi:MAG TPA: multicopper oxidase domain-containing protein [Solirubrobacteraceae bacterium]|nr:multicopper oxidase domain-containing protein [Solirubrobacteraceae bacterium]